MARITALNVYPVKSCKGIGLQTATLQPTGIEHDREWLIVRPNGQFLTQREEPRLALIQTSLMERELQLDAPGVEPLIVSSETRDTPVEVICWRDKCAAFDAGEPAAQWLRSFLGADYRLVRFDRRRKRPANEQWTQGIEALNQFSDGYPFLLISQASLDDLNSRLPQPLPMNRFRPNIVVEGLPAFGEDDVHELRVGEITLRVVKPCTRCAITTTDQGRGERDGDEPLRTLRSYRFSRELKGVLFGQNVILVAGAGRQLEVGQELEVSRKASDAGRS